MTDLKKKNTNNVQNANKQEKKDQTSVECAPEPENGGGVDIEKCRRKKRYVSRRDETEAQDIAGSLFRWKRDNPGYQYRPIYYDGRVDDGGQC